MSLSSPFIGRPAGTTLLTIAVALAGAIASAKHWIRVLGVIQRRSVEKGSSIEA